MGDGRICHMMLIFFINTCVRDIFMGGAKYIVMSEGVYGGLGYPICYLVMFRLVGSAMDQKKSSVYCTRSLEFTPLMVCISEKSCLGANTQCSIESR